MADDDKKEPVAELSDLLPAFDSIDDTMKEVDRKEVTVTPETLSKIVNDAVAQAIAAYEQARGLTPDAASNPGDNLATNPADAPGMPAKPKPPAVPLSPWRASLERLQGDMGINEVEFDAPPVPEADAPPSRIALSREMGVNDFAFDDAPARPVEPAAPVAEEVDVEIGTGFESPPDVAPRTATPQEDDASGIDAARQAPEDLDEGVNWLAAELRAIRTTVERDYVPASARAEAAPAPATPYAPEPIEIPADEPAVPVRVEESRKPEQPEVRQVPPPPEVRPQPEVQVTQKAEVVEAPRTSLSGWFRSAFVAKAPKPVPEPVTANAAPEPAARAVPVRAPVPEPAPPTARATTTAAPPTVAPPKSEPSPARTQAASSKPITPEEAAKTITFTFDPIPPVPPRLPREPKEPPKKIRTSGRFL